MKQYLLLRNNSVSGPFSFDDIIQMDLDSGDLVWIEDHSHSWEPCMEVEELQFYVKELDETLLLRKRAQRIAEMKHSRIDQPSTVYRNNDLDSVFRRDIPLRQTAAFFSERSPLPVPNQVWRKPAVPVANLLNVTLVFITMCFAAIIIKHLVDGFDNNIMMVSTKKFPVNQQPAGNTHLIGNDALSR